MAHNSKLLAVASDIAEAPLTRASADRLGALLNAAMETAADEIPSASRQDLEQAAHASSGLLSAIRRHHDIDRNSPDFLAGRIAALADVYGYSAMMTADDDVGDILQDPTYRSAFDAISNGFQSHHDIAEEIGRSVEETRTILGELCCATIVVMVGHGHNHAYALTPFGRTFTLTQEAAPIQQPRI